MCICENLKPKETQQKSITRELNDEILGSWSWQGTPGISALEKPRQDDQELEASLSSTKTNCLKSKQIHTEMEDRSTACMDWWVGGQTREKYTGDRRRQKTVQMDHAHTDPWMTDG